MPEYIRSTAYFKLAAPGSDGWFEIIGVVGDTPDVGLHEPPAPSIYVPYTLMLTDTVNVILRTGHDPLSIPSIRINQWTWCARRKTRWQARVGPESGS